MRRFRPGCALTLLTAVLVACGGDDDGGPPNPPAGGTTWTILVYGHGDHNLSPSLEQDLLEMQAATLSADMTILVFADWNAALGYPPGAHWYQIRSGSIDELAALEEQNLDDPNVLAAVVREAFQSAPSDRRGIILWNHGGAWIGGFGGDTQDGTINPGAGMAIPDVAAAVAAGLTAAGVTRQLDFFGFDTCLLGSAEAAAEMVGLAQLYIANGEIDYGPGWDYASTFSYLSSHADTALGDLAAAEAGYYDAHHAQVSVADSFFRAHVAVDLGQMQALAQAGAQLVALVDDPARSVAAARAMFGARPAYLNSAFTPDTTTDANLLDLGQVLGLLGSASDPDVAAGAQAMRAALDGTIVASSRGGARAAQVGFHVELTSPIALTQERLDAYAQLARAWNDATGWASLLAQVANSADASAPAVAAAGFSGTTCGIQFSSGDADLADASLVLAQIEDGNVYVFGYLGAGQIDARHEYQFGWMGGGLAIQTDAGPRPIYATPWNLSYGNDGSASAPVFFTPGIIVAGARPEELAMLVFDGSTGAAPLFLVPDVETETWATRFVSEYEGAAFQPIVPYVDPQGGVNVVRVGSVALTGGALAIQTATFANAGYRLLLSVRDVWGNESLTPIDVTLGPGAAPAAAPPRRLPPGIIGRELDHVVARLAPAMMAARRTGEGMRAAPAARIAPAAQRELAAFGAAFTLPRPIAITSR